MRTSYHNHRGPSRQRRERKFQQVGRCSISFPKSVQLRLHYGQILFDSILTCASTYLFSFHFRNQRACHRCTTQRRPLQAPLPGPRSVSDAAPGGLVLTNFNDFFAKKCIFQSRNLALFSFKIELKMDKNVIFYC